MTPSRPPSDAPPASAARSFESDLERLQAIVEALEGDGVDLDRALRLFEEGVERLRGATAELSRAEAQVRLLVERTDGTFDLPTVDAFASHASPSGPASGSAA